MRNIAHCNLITGEHGVTVLDDELNYIEVRVIIPEELVESSKTTPIRLLKIDDSGTTEIGEFSNLEINEIIFNLSETITSYTVSTFQYQISDGNYISELVKFHIGETLDAVLDEIYIDYIQDAFEIVKVRVSEDDEGGSAIHEEYYTDYAGYVWFESGFLTQWGRVSVTPTAMDTDTTLRVTFTHQYDNIPNRKTEIASTTPKLAEVTSDGGTTVELSKQGMNIYVNSSTTRAVTIDWKATGYKKV